MGGGGGNGYGSDGALAFPADPLSQAAGHARELLGEPASATFPWGDKVLLRVMNQTLVYESTTQALYLVMVVPVPVTAENGGLSPVLIGEVPIRSKADFKKALLVGENRHYSGGR